MAKRALFETLRSLAFGGITGAYAAIGTALTNEARLICITNDTDAGMIISTDPSNATGQLYLPEGTFKLLDLTANMNPNIDDGLYLAVGTIIYVKQAAAPSSGAVYVEIVYGV